MLTEENDWLEIYEYSSYGDITMNVADYDWYTLYSYNNRDSYDKSLTTQ